MYLFVYLYAAVNFELCGYSGKNWIFLPKVLQLMLLFVLSKNNKPNTKLKPRSCLFVCLFKHWHELL